MTITPFRCSVWAYIHLGNEDDPKDAAKTTNEVVDSEQKAHDPERSWATHISQSNEGEPSQDAQGGYYPRAWPFLQLYTHQGKGVGTVTEALPPVTLIYFKI